MSTDPKQILILGGGFAGVYTARYLEKMLRPEEASITLINRENYWVYQPMLPEIISGSIGLTNVVSPIRRLCPRTNLIMREVEGIDLGRQIVIVSPGFRPRPLQLQYDYLVIALGTVTNFHGMPGTMENAMPFRTLADAMVLRNHLIHVLEEADVEDDPGLRRQLLTFVVGGGGFSGVEVMAELNDFVQSVKRSYLRLSRCSLDRFPAGLFSPRQQAWASPPGRAASPVTGIILMSSFLGHGRSEAVGASVACSHSSGLRVRRAMRSPKRRLSWNGTSAAHGGRDIDGGGTGLANGMLGRRRNHCAGDGLD